LALGFAALNPGYASDHTGIIDFDAGHWYFLFLDRTFAAPLGDRVGRANPLWVFRGKE
jgi:hypothetical protein